ncbi:MAG: hypothetical protein ACH34X_16740 [Thiolinea sp.]
MVDKRSTVTLRVPREEANQKIAERIKIGYSLLSVPIKNEESLSAEKDQYHTWDDYNVELLSRVFSSESMSEEYSRAEFSIWSSTQTFSDDVKDYKNDVKAKIRYLSSIIERLDLITEANQDKVQKVFIKRIDFKKINNKVWAFITVLSTIIGLIVAFYPDIFQKEKTIDTFEIYFRDSDNSMKFINFITTHYDMEKIGAPFRLTGLPAAIVADDVTGEIDYVGLFGGALEESFDNKPYLTIYIPDLHNESCSKSFSKCSKYVFNIDGDHYKWVYRAGGLGYEFDGYFRVESIQSYSQWCTKFQICSIDPRLKDGDIIVDLVSFSADNAMLLLR